MYAVIKSGGKQYRVKEGDIVRLEKIDAEVGGEIELDQVMLVRQDNNFMAGPDVAEASVTAVVTEQEKSRKIVVFKKRRRKNYVRTQGHRQFYTAVRITGINLSEAAVKQSAERE